MEDLRTHGRVRRAVLGVSIGEVAPADAKAAGLDEIRGIKVQAFVPTDDSPARKAGLEVGDVIIGAQGQRVNRVSELQRLIRGFKPGDVVDIEVMRFGAKKNFKVRLAEPPRQDEEQVASADRPSAAPVSADSRSNARLGITVTPVSEEFVTARQVDAAYRQGLLVTEVSIRGNSYRELFANRDIILRVLHPTRKDIRTATDLEQVANTLKSGDVLSLLVYDTAARSTRAVTIAIN